MAEYDFEAIAVDGTLHKGRVTAVDVLSATREMEARDLVVVRVSLVTQRSSRFSALSLFARTIKQADITILLLDLAALVQSRLRIDEALQLMLQEIELGNTRHLMIDLLRRL